MITVQGLTKYYGDKCAVSDLNFEIASGEIVGILGLNGAGKTTTLKILACLLLPSAGKVKINGLDVNDAPHEIRKQVGFLPEDPPLYREMTVEAFLTFTAELRGQPRQHARTQVEKVLETTHTKEVRGEIIANLSHGYRKRVGIGQAIIHQPPLLILDEPISGLDPVQIVEIREMIRGLKGSHTILVSSHILPEISQTCDRILMIQDGRLVASGTEEELTGRVTGTNRLHLIVRGEKEKILTSIRGIEGVKTCRVIDRPNSASATSNEDTKAHHIEVDSESDIREQLSQTIVQGGFGLRQLRPAEAELESIFLQLTQKREVSQ